MLHEMKYIYTVYEEKSFSKAAKKLYMSQPALSKMVKKVEREIGTPIFDRSTVPFTVTREGRIFLDATQRILLEERNLLAYFSDLRELNVGHLSLGGAAYYCSFIFPDLINAFHRQHPGITIDLLEGNIDQLAQGLEQEKLDIVLETGLNSENTRVRRIHYHDEVLILAVPASFEVNEALKDYQLSLASIQGRTFLNDQTPPVPLDCFRGVPFINMKRGNDLYHRANEICENAGFHMHTVMYLDQVLTSMNIIRKSAIGACFIRSDIVRYASSDGLIYYKIADPLARRPVNFVVKKDRYLSHAAEAFIALSLKHRVDAPRVVQT